ncbi:DUF992 domain-containing protein [Mesorhizobium sp. ESP6-5]|uniref:DUF992 domain-containing protein n=1 Tax=Mesorhizobium australicum (strain HAMBI 3006 / LMG 24608 / WSM2073) TaxID=754035 RepID=L0KG70_MESAW|nr:MULTISPECIES: DUF992 domain-containing protein [Mesorhizobium]AGB44317.1 Protein of unknown function (DUF992) [Mesorhizobium australicum WSM2073]MBZ9695205.1 DUF992 domain-containing protein [Mesorhizobium sp. CO1-1-9]MBZ9757122.1 DUF992 domain-containing protein [Mesorhizobium sp. ESP6-5]TPK16034.1 DUF992 domain-containing protein [Mesorhizobium sp. B2-5-7]TPM00584.1 DUF992 domain-containing protein [Mesorhizobium sp. B2-3-10]
MFRTAIAAAATTIMLAGAARAQDQGIELGALECAISGGTGFIFGSSKDLSCTFTPADKSFAPEAYFGAVNKYGLDIGTTKQAVMRWLVLTPLKNIYAPGALAGDYIGASAEVTAAVGAGANLLVGGSSQAFTLQPLSLQTQTGINLAIGVSQFQLRSTEN